MSESRNKKILLVAAAWIAIGGVLAVGYKVFVSSKKSDEAKELLEDTGSSSQYKHTIKVRADSFSGYAVLRSDLMKKQMRKHKIRLKIEDDKADYIARMKALRDGDADMAVFTVDAFITAGAKLGGDYPASIAMVIDETVGGDAIVAYKTGLGKLRDLDDPNARIVMTPNSPSEFLARVVIAHFSLLSLPEKWWIEADGAEDVYKKLKSTSKREKKAFVLWEPYVSMALKDPDVHVLLGSDKVKGHIVDVLVVNRKFLDKHPEQVRAVVESYMRAQYSYTKRSNGMTDLVLKDAKLTGTAMTNIEARYTVNGIEWKNTVENYAYFGIKDVKGVPTMEDVINNITSVLVKTGALPKNPVEGRTHTLFYDGIFKGLDADNFHPGKRLEVVKGIGPTPDDLDHARTAAALPPLTDEQWGTLTVVGNMRIEPLVFGRGNARISSGSERELDDLAKRIRSWPQYYIRIVGHARAEGDKDANLKLSKKRAEAARDYLVELGISENRLRAEAATVQKKGGAGQSVSFVVGTVPY